MIWESPSWWPFVLLALAAFRCFRLISEDTIFDRPRVWGSNRLGAKYDEWITCMWCAGAWCAAAWWAAWIVSHRWTLVVATPFAISAAVGLVAKNLDRDE